MFDNSRVLSLGRTYHEELERVTQHPNLLDAAERAALMTEYDRFTATAGHIFPPLELSGHSRIMARFLAKDDTRAMVESGSPAIYVSGLRVRREREFMDFVKEQRRAGLEILDRQTRVAYRSREWGVWLHQIGRHRKLWVIATMLRVQAITYRFGFASDPTRNLERLDALFRGSPKSPTV